MKNWVAVLVAVGIVVSVSMDGCADLRKDLPTAIPAGVVVHPAGWNDTLSSSFHGKILRQGQFDLSGCISCHSKSFNGGTSGVACFKCHALFPHPPEWKADTSSAGFHGKFLLSGKGRLVDCATCHGNTFDGGTSGVTCYNCHASYPHNSGWVDDATPNSHGKYLKAKQWQIDECAACHGATFNGGTSGTSCFTCHAAFPHSIVFAAAGGHTVYLKNNRYPLPQCQACHGVSYAGGSVVNVSCSQAGCHIDRNGVPKTPESCNTCHGDFTAPASNVPSFAPPKTLAGDTATTIRGVGAHQKHLATGSLGRSVNCRECHAVPNQVFAAGHLGAPPAEVVFLDTLAGLVTGDGTNRPNPVYDGSTLKCSNTYCHGNWRVRRATTPFAAALFYTDSIMTGLRYNPAWTNGSSDAACGTCHGLPPAGHVPHTLSECALCHAGVVDENGVIIDKTKHINGKINVFGIERSY